MFDFENSLNFLLVTEIYYLVPEEDKPFVVVENSEAGLLFFLVLSSSQTLQRQVY